ncbi:MAG: ABC transporter permease subunit [Planctomycetota bacterium]|nr:ABC transporter permease subunit [Planctomycetota bacterium]
MSTLRELYRRLDLLQRTLPFRVAVSVLALALCGVVFGSLITTSDSLHAQRSALVEALTGQNLNERDDHAVTLSESGTVVLDGRTYREPRLADRPDLIFDDSGEIALPQRVAETLLRDQYPDWAPRWLLEQPGTVWMLAAVATMWLQLIVWMSITIPFLATVLGTAAAVGLAALTGSEQAMWAFGGIGLLTFTFVLLIRAMLILYHRPNQILAVAHTVLKEASRTMIPLVFIVLILIILPLLPIGLDPESPLRFRIQTFISRSLGFTFYLAASMTLFLSCATVAFEIRDRQIWQLMTKPVNRFSYLLGKWLGVVTVNLIILVIAAVSSFTFIQYLREQPVAATMAGQEDAQQVRDAVLTARVGTSPSYDTLDETQLRARVDELIERTPELATMEEVPLLQRRELRRRIELAYAASQRTVPPRGGAREYVFEGLSEARELQSTLTLRYRFHIMRDDEHKTFDALFVFNRDPNLAVSRSYVPTVTHTLSIPANLIQEDGTLSVTVVNLFEPPPDARTAGGLNFEADDFELLYKVGSFEANFFRAVFVDWVKLSFLAMLGICCATFLNFPVACLTSFTIFIAGTIGPFLADSLQEYYPPAMEAMDWGNVALVIQWAFQTVIRFIAQGIVFLLQSFGEYRPTQSLIEGRLIEWSAVAGGLIKVGLVWSGLAMIVGYLVIRRRQLAIYSGHG